MEQNVTAVQSPLVDSAPATLLPNLDRIIRGLLYVYIFSLPFHLLLFVERNGFLILLALLTVWCLVHRRHFFRRTPVDMPLLALTGWVGISLLGAASPAYSLHEFGKLLQQGLLFYVVLHFFREEADRTKILWVLLMSLAVISLYGIWQFDVKPWFGENDPRGRAHHLIHSFFSAEVWLIAYLVTLIPLSAAMAVYASVRWQRMVAAFVASVAIACLFLTFSRAGAFALSVEAVIFAILVRKKLVTGLVTGVITTVIVGGLMLTVVQRTEGINFVPGETKFTTYNLVARFKVWRLGAAKMLESPVIGHGYGKDAFYVLTENDPNRIAANAESVPMPTGLHNTFLDISVGAGIPAGLAYLWLMWTIGRAALERFRRAENHLLQVWPLAIVMMVTGLFVRNSFDHMWIGTMAQLFWVMVGLSLEPVPSRPHEIRTPRTG